MTIKRRSFLIGSLSGLTLLTVAACSPQAPTPTPTVPPTRTKLPQPSAFERSNFTADPFSRGGSSFYAVGSSEAHRAALREPVDERVFFAGEHTAEVAAGTVLGARVSGRRAALQVMQVAEPGERIAIVGAGIAGATAARLLTDEGFSVVIVEGRERAGGRVLTLDDDRWPFPVELGASWVYDASLNSVATALASHDIATQPFELTYDRRTMAGDTLEALPAAAAAVDEAVVWAAGQPVDLSLADSLVESGAANLNVRPNEAGVSEADMLENFVSSDVVVATGADADQLSAWFTDDLTRETESDRWVTGGFSALLTQELDGIDILPSSMVSAVSENSNGVSLRLARGESLSAARAIVTVPLGVLQAASIEFDPPLPFSHRGAINALGVGLLDKIVLRFDEPFWSTDATAWSVVDGDTDFPLWYNLLPLTGEPVLVGVIAGEAARRLSEFDDQDLLEAALASLEPFLAPEPQQVPGSDGAD